MAAGFARTSPATGDGDAGLRLENVRFFYNSKILLPFFRQHPERRAGIQNFPPAYVFETGTNVWLANTTLGRPQKP